MHSFEDTPAARAPRVRLPVAAALALLIAFRVGAQGTVAAMPASNAPSSSSLDSLVGLALRASPSIRAARDRIDAANARVGPAGARPDPMLMAGIVNFPISEPGFRDFMTMKMVGVSQTFPYPGKLSRRTDVAEQEVAAERADADAARRRVVRDVRVAYYDLAFTIVALDIVRRTQGVVAGMIPVTEARYAAGSATQPDVLRIRVSTARLADEGAALVEEQRATLARLNALLDRPSNADVADAMIPPRIARAAVADSARQIAFASSSLGARVSGSPLLPLDTVEMLALANSPALRAADANIAAQGARVALARREHLPDIGVSLQYGQRNNLSDMVTAIVSLPIPLQKRRNQDAALIAASSERRAMEAERAATANTLRADVARLHGALERDRTQLALYVKAMLPQARAALQSAAASYQSGRVDFATLVDTQSSLFTYETDYYRALTDFAKTLAELEEQTGTEVLR